MDTIKYVIFNNIKYFDFNLNKYNCIFLGKWCVPYQELDKYKEYEFFPFIWKDRKRYEKSYWYLNDVFEDILDVLYKKINTLFKLNYDKQFYRIILSPWLIHYLHQIFDKYILLKDFISMYSHQQEYIFLISNNEYIPNDYSDFLNKIIINEDYNSQQFAKLIKFFNLKSQFIKIKDFNRENLSYRIQANMKKKILRMIFKLFTKNSYTTIVNPYFLYSPLRSKIELLIKSNFTVIFDDFDYDIKINLYKDLEKRKSLLFDNCNLIKDEFYDYLNKNLMQDIPLLYFENITKVINMIDNLKIQKTKLYYTANAHYSNELYKFYIAKYKKNIKTIIAQHGGVNGTHLLSLEEVENKLADYFFTFGWKDRKNEIPMYSYNMSLLKNSFRHKPKKNNILFISTAQPRRIFRFHSSYSADEFENLIYNSIDFINFLHQKVDLMYRRYPVHLGWYTEEIIQNNINKKLIFDSNKKIIDSYKIAEIVVSNHIGSTYLESISLNIPTIVFCDEQVTKFRESAIDMYQKLRNVKIFHKDGVSAAMFINELYKKNMLYEWWNSEQVQNVRQDFIKKYTNLSNNWYKEFLEKIKDIANE